MLPHRWDACDNEDFIYAEQLGVSEHFTKPDAWLDSGLTGDNLKNLRRRTREKNCKIIEKAELVFEARLGGASQCSRQTTHLGSSDHSTPVV